jgi:hypothetical protein
MEPREAVLAVLREEAEPLHWTKVLDRALRQGYLDPFVHRDVRGAVQRSLRDLVAEGAVTRVEKGVYAIVDQDDAEA